jgi:hypothetical protein
MYMQHTTSGAAGNGLYTTIKYMRGASGIGMGTTIKHLRYTTSGAAGNALGATMKYLRRTMSAAANNGMSTTTTPPCNAAAFEVNSEPHTGAHPSVRLCVGPELARCVHYISLKRQDPTRLSQSQSPSPFSVDISNICIYFGLSLYGCIGPDLIRTGYGISAFFKKLAFLESSQNK